MPAAKGKIALWVTRWIVQTLFLVIALGAGTGVATAGTVPVDRVGPSDLELGVLVGATGVASPHLRWVFGESCGEQAHGPPLAPKGGVGAADDTVTLYHHTTEAGYEGIKAAGKIKGSPGRGLWRPWAKGDVYLTTKPQLNWWNRLTHGLTKSKTAKTVPVELPANSVFKRLFGIRVHPGDVPVGPLP